MRPIVHAITAGDHFSPRTGSAVPTVIDGLARAGAGTAQARSQRVLVAEGTYLDRYESVEALQYRQRPDPTRIQRAADLLAGRLSGARPFQRYSLEPMLAGQRQWAPSLIVAHNLIQLLPLVDAARHRAVLYAHNDLLRTYSRREAAKALEEAALIVCVSEFLADRIRHQLPTALHQRVVVTPNAADCQQFTPGSSSSQPLRVAFVGRMVAAKGPDVLLRAAALLEEPAPDGPALEITIVGSTGFNRRAELSAYERKLREMAEGLSATVRFRPFTDRHQLPRLLRTQDILAVPSRWPEPWGLTVSEGQAAGLVVLASDVGGIGEAISDPGHLIPPDDAGALAEQLRRFHTDRQLLASHRRSARAYAEAHGWRSSWDTLAGHLAGVE